MPTLCPPPSPPAGLGEAHFAHAMCRQCYLEFMTTSGGLHNGANPPAFERNRRKEMMELLALPEPGEALLGHCVLRRGG